MVAHQDFELAEQFVNLDFRLVQPRWKHERWKNCWKILISYGRYFSRFNR